jgi:hypothetical protein
MAALLPQPVSVAQPYLKRVGLDMDGIRQVPLSNKGVRGTPATLLVNSSGIIV